MMSSTPLLKRPARGASRRIRDGVRTQLACINCKEKKLKCDERTPACSNCSRSDLVCLVEDPATKRQQPRNYLEYLERRVALQEKMINEWRATAHNVAASSKTSAPNDEIGNLAADDDHNTLNHLSSMVGTLSINAAGAEPHYLGPTSAFAFARFIKPSLHEAVSTAPVPDDHVMLTPDPCLLPDYHVAVRLSDAYFENIHPQYPFLHEPTFRIWEATLEEHVDTVEALGYDPLPLYFLNMVYAIGARLLPGFGYSPEQLYVSAMLYIDDILCRENLESIQAILCAAAYSLRSAKGTSHWKLAGQAVRQCVSLGYHRCRRRLAPTVTPFQLEFQKRAFWSAYEMECSAAVMLGRPLSLHFQEIDVEFPLDIEESYITTAGIIGPARDPRIDPATMMTHAIAGFRARTLQGRIQTSLYLDNTLKDHDIRQKCVQQLRHELEEWKANCPSSMLPPRSGTLSFFTTPDWYQVSYNITLCQIYRPQITDSKVPASDAIFKTCLEAAKRTCHSYRRQLVGKCTTYTWGAIHELFLAGLTYIYCLWSSPAAREMSRQDHISSTCTDCTMFLVVAAERWSEAAPYRDIFEALASRTMTMMAQVSQGEEVRSNAFTLGQDQYPAELPQWVAGLADTEMSVGYGCLLNGLIDDYSSLGGLPDNSLWS